MVQVLIRLNTVNIQLHHEIKEFLWLNQSYSSENSLTCELSRQDLQSFQANTVFSSFSPSYSAVEFRHACIALILKKSFSILFFQSLYLASWGCHPKYPFCQLSHFCLRPNALQLEPALSIRKKTKMHIQNVQWWWKNAKNAERETPASVQCLSLDYLLNCFQVCFLVLCFKVLKICGVLNPKSSVEIKIWPF